MSKLAKDSFPKYLRWSFFAAIAGVLAGSAAALFLIFLSISTQTRDANPAIIYLLPLSGLAIGLLYQRVGKNVAGGNNLILEEIHDPQKVVPLRMAPMVFIGTILTHLFGGSAGREGTAVQMGATLSDQLSRFFSIERAERKILLVCGAGAGFGAAIGAPWAGVFFGMEVIHIGRLKIFALLECLIASFVAYYTTLFLHAPHSRYFLIDIPYYDAKTFMWIAIAGILFGLTARFFIWAVHLVEKFHEKFCPAPEWRPFLGGIALITLYGLFAGSYRYAGLGISVIQHALTLPPHWSDPLNKILYTALTIGSGFKGGEFIPLVFIGTTLGSVLGYAAHVSFQVVAAVGFAAVFAGGANTPFACSLMAMEIFGHRLGPYAFLGCYLSYFFSGHKSIYAAQKIREKKHHSFKNFFGELAERF